MKLQFAYETETFLNDGGYYVIKQTDDVGQESFTVLTREQCKLIQEDMLAELSEPHWYNQYDEE